MNGVCPADDDAIDRMNAEEKLELTKVLEELTPEEKQTVAEDTAERLIAIGKKLQEQGISGSFEDVSGYSDEELELYRSAVIRTLKSGPGLSASIERHPTNFQLYVASGAMNSQGQDRYTIVNTSLGEVLQCEPPEIWIVIDSAYVAVNLAENKSFMLQEEIGLTYPKVEKVSMHSGPVDAKFVANSHVVLIATACGFYVEKARGTDTAGKYIPYK